MASPAGLLSLLQLTDSFFPSGGFAYSWGLETCVSDGLVAGREGLEQFLSAYLGGQLAGTDALGVKVAHEAAERGDLAAVMRLDGRLNAMKIARESREGGLQIGRQILKVMTALHQSTLLREFARKVENRQTFGHHAPVFGLACQAMGVSKPYSVQAFLYQAASGVVSAGVRLIPLGHMDGQRALYRIRETIGAIARAVEPLGEEDLSSFAPALEIRAMRHETLYSRLFRS